MGRFPSAGHLASWVGLCPRNNESAGKHKGGETRKGSTWLRTTLMEAALAAIRSRDTALAARYWRIMRHRGHKKTVIAVAHAILVTAYHLLVRQTNCMELGPRNLDQLDVTRATRCDVRSLELLDHRVILERAA